MTEYIDRQAIIEKIRYQGIYGSGFSDEEREDNVVDMIESIPAADVRPVVLCGVCELHGHCYTEDVFAFARLAEENRFCAVGKVKTNSEKREES